MPTDPIRILNFDGSVTAQKKLLSGRAADVIDLTDLGPDARAWLDKKTGEEITRRLSASRRDSVTFLGSGDFHHISALLLEQFEEAISVIVFDHHPDWDILPPRLGCGSWVSAALKRKNISRVILMGVSSDDISSIWVQTGDLGSLKSGRAEIYPYSHRPSVTLFKKIPDNVSIRAQRNICSGRIYWNELRKVNLVEFFLHILRRLPTKKVYLSIDKDCLRNEFAVTNWEEGLMSLDELLLMVKLIKENLDIAGADIVGDYSPPHIRSRFKEVLSYLDHPRDIKAGRLTPEAITEINEATNLKILKILS